jgi:D-alanine--poly(phosphoribitol) ligase subunit 2
VESSSIEGQIEDYLQRNFKVSPSDPDFSRDADLFSGGYIDSVGFAELLAFLAERFGVEVPESDLLSDEFSSIEGIAAVVRRLMDSR